MSKDCDIFSDAYGCVFTDCEGYQTPYPILRLGSSHCNWELKAIAHGGGPLARHQLLTLDLTPGAACRSFAEVLSTRAPPVNLQQTGDGGAEFFRGVESGDRVTSTVSRARGGAWSASFLVGSGPGTRQYVVPGVHAASRHSDAAIWALHGGGNSVAVISAEELACPAPDLDAVLAPVPAPGTAGVGEIISTSASTAVVVHSRGSFAVDRRDGASGRGTLHQPLPDGALLLPVGSCGLAGEGVLVCCTAEGRLLAFDRRKAGAGGSPPLLDKRLGSHVRVRAWQDERTVLLLAADQVGVLDTRTLTLAGALQQSSDGDVLDATLLPSSSSSHIRICTSALNGMLYSWRMSG